MNSQSNDRPSGAYPDPLPAKAVQNPVKQEANMIYQENKQVIRLNDNLKWEVSEMRKERKSRMEVIVLTVMSIIAIAMRIGLYLHNKKVMNGEDD